VISRFEVAFDSIPMRLAAKPAPYSATAVTVTIIAQM